MYRNWKRAAALGLAVLIGGMMPMSTMLAAEEDAGTEMCSTADAGMTGSDESAPENENKPEGENEPGGENRPADENEPGGENASADENEPDGENEPADENVPGGENRPADENDLGGENEPTDENVPDGENEPADENEPGGENEPEDEEASDVEDTPDLGDTGILNVPAAKLDAQPQEAEVSESTDAPEIFITREGQNRACSLGGKITFEYVNNWGTLFEVSVGQSDDNVSLFYRLDEVADTDAEAKTEEQMGSLIWGKIDTMPGLVEPLRDGNYVVYVKATVTGEQEKTCYARSNGIVVDTKRPVIKGVVEGKAYPEGTVFQVEDDNLDRVLVNEQPAVFENGNYKVAANGSACVIRAIDKAGNETACSITVSTEEKPETDHVISKSGVYALKAGEKYRLAQGQWKVDGDKSVYQGGSDFYVSADGDYSFTK